MRILLDTHVWIWRLLEPERLSPAASEALSAYDSECFLSPISVWETLVLGRKGRVELAPDPGRWVRTALQRSSLAMAPITHEIAFLSEHLEGLRSRDPADRFLVATAETHDLAFVTADRQILGYDRIDTIAAG